jgi:hypothetical protein
MDDHMRAADEVDEIIKRDGIDGLQDAADDQHRSQLVREHAARVLEQVREMDPELGNQWWRRVGEPLYTLELLQRSGVLPHSEDFNAEPRLREFREKPWKWSRERLIALRIESIFVRYEIPRADGWEMSLQDVAALAERNTRGE